MGESITEWKEHATQRAALTTERLFLRYQNYQNVVSAKVLFTIHNFCKLLSFSTTDGNFCLDD